MDRLRSLLPALVACALVAFAALSPAAAVAQTTGGASPEAGDERRSERPRTRDRDAAVEDAEEVDSEKDSDSSGGRPAGKARIVGGQAVPPANAPAAVKTAIAAANKIANLPYRYGGGHGKVEDTAYDCSGAISYALIKAGLLPAPLASDHSCSGASPARAAGSRSTPTRATPSL